MKIKWALARWSLFILLLAAAVSVYAQGASPLAALVNSSGQLVAASGDGAARWILTNPGETLAQPVGFTWSPDGQRLFFAVNVGGTVSLRVGGVNTQTIIEIGQTGRDVSGGDWTPDSRFVLLASGDSISLYPASGGEPTVVASAPNGIRLISPYLNDRPNLPAPRSLSPDGRFVFYWQSDGRYALQAVNGGAPLILPGFNDPDAPQSGLWSEPSALVAYWGFDGANSILSVTSANSGQTATLNSGRSAPIVPVAWRPGTAQLVYRDTTNFVRLADMGCLQNGCGANPLESGVELLSATASDIQFGENGGWLLFRDGEQIRALNLACVSSGSCIDSAVTIGQNAAQRTWLHVAGGMLAYTAYTKDAANPSDRQVNVIDLSCLRDPAACRPAASLGQAVAGLLSFDGRYLTLDQSGRGLLALDIADLAVNYLADSLGGALGSSLSGVRWSP